MTIFDVDFMMNLIRLTILFEIFEITLAVLEFQIENGKSIKVKCLVPWLFLLPAFPSLKQCFSNNWRQR